MFYGLLPRAYYGDLLLASNAVTPCLPLFMIVSVLEPPPQAHTFDRLRDRVSSQYAVLHFCGHVIRASPKLPDPFVK